MNDVDLNRAYAIFLQASELETDDQEQWVLKACGEDAHLLQKVKSLLKASKASSDFLDDMMDDTHAFQLNEIEDHCYRGRQFGPYQVISILKQGGMGSVFLARRADGEFNRRVIIKMIQMGMNFRQNQTLFAHEKKVLASLNHPNIVQLYDSGETEDGQSWFAMEWVNGTDISKYCQSQKLTLTRRLQLFMDILAAVQFAHQHLVIHGDIKPGNILVNEGGQIKLLDFGIARLLRSEEPEMPAHSVSYLTPEQSAKESAITTATDIHQLGQLLFEILTLLTPAEVRSKDFRFPSLSQVLQIHRNQAGLNDLSRYTQTSISGIRRVYQGDLQHIIAKALEPDPHQRYPTVQALADDLLASAQHQIISARPVTMLYRVQKYLRRHLLGVALGSMLVLMSLGYAFMSARHSKTLAAERDKAIAVKDLLIEVFTAADPSVAPGRELSATEVLDRGLDKVREKHHAPSSVVADLLQSMAITYQNLGQYSKAQSVLSEALEMRRLVQADEPVILAETMTLMGENQRLMSDHAAAENWFQQALKLLEQSPDPVARALIISKLSRVKMLQGALPEAEQLGLEATAQIRKSYGTEHLLYAKTLNDLSSVYFRLGKYQEVEKLLLETKSIREALQAPQQGPLLDHDYATNINNLGLAAYLKGDLEQGEVYFRQAIALRNQIYTDPHPEQAQSLTNLGLLLNDAGKPHEALPFLQQALIIRESTLEPNHMLIHDAHNNLAMSHHENGQFQQAVDTYLQVLPDVEKLRGSSHPQTAAIYTNLANSLLELGRFAEAQDYFQRSLKARIATLPQEHLYLSYSYVGLGQALAATGDIQRALEMLEKGLAIREKALPKDHWLVVEARLALMVVQDKLGLVTEDSIKPICEALTLRKGEQHHLSQRCLELLHSISL
ncbi:MAG: serine/threonine protein kinase [Xanthomonadales bacterium]|nr:serine/threonine protein kinase [Xanthomonadales bacterium]